jgi:hypothetical protein
VRARRAARRVLPALHGDRARTALHQRDEPVQRLQRDAAAGGAGVEVVRGAVGDAGGGVGGALDGGGGGREVVEGDDEGDAKVREEVGVEGGAEDAAAVGVGVVALAGGGDGGVVGGVGEEELAGDEGEDAAIDGTVKKPKT